ncbi:MAG: hypothetical protein P1U58_05090 [Verrucomicrobiales bacterium]|nr:hypothetical protein [Verrucomicrobiales bacterium]
MSGIVATAFLCLCVLPGIAKAQKGIDPSDIWYRAFILVQSAKEMEAQGRFLEAINKLDEAMPLYDHLAQQSPEFQPEIVRTRRNLIAEKRDQLKIAMGPRAQADLHNYRVWFVCSALGILSVILIATMLFKRKQGGEQADAGKPDPASS